MREGSAPSMKTAMDQPRLAVVAAAGHGRRIHPRSRTVPKVMLEVAGRPLLIRNLELIRDQLEIEDVIVVVGHLGDQIRAALGDGSKFGLRLRYVENPDVEGGLGTVLSVIEPCVDEPFVMLLGDELYLGSNHRALRSVEAPFTAICALWPCDDPEQIRKNYVVERDGDRITGLIEKPEKVASRELGCGTFVFAPEIFLDARATRRSPRTGKFELIDVIDHAARRGAAVRAFELTGTYFNVNTVEDLNVASYAFRNADFVSKRVSVIIPCYDEAGSIRRVVGDFLPHVHEVVVMDNLSADGSAEIARDAGANVHSRALAGYGDALKQGMDAASGDILVLVEADGTFRAKDLGKLLEFLKDADMVLGTRTTRQMIEQGANMDGLLRLGNLVVGKIIEALWWGSEPRFTDVGCTYRALWVDAYHRIRPFLKRSDAAFSPEMMIEMLRVKGRVIEVPVSYYRRQGGASKHSSTRWHSVRTGLTMLGLIFGRRLNLS